MFSNISNIFNPLKKNIRQRIINPVKPKLLVILPFIRKKIADPLMYVTGVPKRDKRANETGAIF